MHVHVFKQGELIINLGDDENAVFVRENNGMSARDERRALIIVGDNQEFLQMKWQEIYG